MKALSKKDETPGPGPVIVRIILSTLLLATCVVALSGPMLGRLDQWMDSVQHQVYTFIGLFMVLAGCWLFWWFKRNV